MFAKLLFLLLAASAQRGTMEQPPWDALPAVTGELCPNTCMWRHLNTSTEMTGGVDYCCKDCSCDDDCGLEEKCCFPELDKYTNTARPNSCTYTTTANISTQMNKYVWPSYRIVDKNPKFGCIISINGNNSAEQCGTISVAWWGSLFPVTSKTTGKIYRNRKCAICHNDTRFQEWDVQQVCSGKQSQLAVSGYADFSIAATTFSNGCYYSFKAKSSDKNLIEKRCFNDLVEYCKYPTTFTIPEGINLTRTGIIKACESGFRSAIKAYSNIFCYICSKGKLLRACSRDVIHRNPSSITFLMSGTEIAKYSQSRENYTEDIACRRVENGVNRSDCVQVFCPSGQMRLGNKCDFLAKRWSAAVYQITIRLVPLHHAKLDISLTDDFATCLQNQNDPKLKFCLDSPWRRQWIIRSLYYKTDGSINNTYIQELCVSITYTNSINPKTFMEMVRKTMQEQTWTFHVRNKAIRFFQEFNKDEPFKNENYQRIFARNVILLYALVDITRLFFCDRTTLDEADFEVISGNVLYLKKSGNYLQKYEHYRVTTEGKRMQALVCLSDAAYEAMTSLNVIKSSASLPENVIVLLTTVTFHCCIF